MLTVVPKQPIPSFGQPFPVGQRGVIVMDHRALLVNRVHPYARKVNVVMRAFALGNTKFFFGPRGPGLQCQRGLIRFKEMKKADGTVDEFAEFVERSLQKLL